MYEPPLLLRVYVYANARDFANSIIIRGPYFPVPSEKIIMQIIVIRVYAYLCAITG